MFPPEAGGDGGDDLRDEPVKVGVGGPLHRQVVVAQVVDGLDNIAGFMLNFFHFMANHIFKPTKTLIEPWGKYECGPDE